MTNKLRFIRTPKDLIQLQIEILEREIKEAEFDLSQHTEEAQSLSSRMKSLKDTLESFKQYQQTMGEKND